MINIKRRNEIPVAEICLLHKDPGPCRGSVLRWYYDDITGSCRQFFYGGCLGNNNRFKTEAECKQKCHIVDPDRGISHKQKSKHILAFTLQAVKDAAKDQMLGCTKQFCWVFSFSFLTLMVAVFFSDLCVIFGYVFNKVFVSFVLCSIKN